MKLLGKIVVILIAALMVAGATLALENSGALSSLMGGAGHGSGGRGERLAGAATNVDGAFASGERSGRELSEHGEDGHDSPTSSLLGVARNLGIVAAVVAGVWLISRLGGQAAIRRKLSKTATPPPLKEEASLEKKA